MSRPPVAASTLRLLMAEGLVVPSGLVTAAYLGRAIGPELYGLFSVATAVSVTLEWVLASLLGRTTVKVVAEASDWKPVASTILVVHFVAGVAVALACWVFADPLARFLGDERLRPWLSLLAIEVPIAATAAACRNIMTGRGNYRGRALSTAVRWIVRPLAIVLFVDGGLAVTGAVLGSITAAAAGWLVAIRMAGAAILSSRPVAISGIWQLAVPVFVMALSLRLIDKLGLLAIQASGWPPAEAGFYAAAQNFAIAPGLMALSFSPVLLAELTRLRVAGDDRGVARLSATSLRLVAGVVPWAALGAVSSLEIVRLVYGPGFDQAARLAWPLLAAALGMLLISVASAVLIACDRASTAARSVWPWVPPTIVALAWAVPDRGPMAAALITAGAVAGAAAVSLTAVGRAVGVLPPIATIARSIVVSVLLGACAAIWPAPGLWVVVKVAVLAALAPIAFALLGEFGPASPDARDPATPGPDPGAAAYWDRVASDWDLARADPWRDHADAVNLSTCERWWPAAPVGRVLKTDLFDEVAGRGLVPELSQRAAAVIAIDRSFEAARLARGRGTARACSADVRTLPFVDDAFDLVVSNSTLDHFDRVEDIGRALAEIRRVLAPGGRLILTLDNPANPAIRLRNALPFAMLNRLGLVPYFVGATLDSPAARRTLTALGFHVVAVSAVLHCPRALAIGGLGAARHLVGVAWQRRLSAWLMSFERLERWPSRHLTGYYVAVAADVDRVDADAGALPRLPAACPPANV